MGLGMADIEYLSDRGLLPIGKARVLDIGSSNLHNLDGKSALRFIGRHGGNVDHAAVQKEAGRLAYFSTPRPGERTLYLSELFDQTPDIFYTSYDVCPALKTEIFDLNRQSLPEDYKNSFDVVLNCGTTEHVINQHNSFEVIHDALRVGGVAFHQVPSVGWLDHGYFTYHATFFDDLVAANDYELVDRWYVPERLMALNPATDDIRSAYTPQIPHSGNTHGLQLGMQCYNICVVVRKRRDAPFRIGLELATSHSGLSEQVQAAYRAG